ncbi:MAG: hypothetical protein A2Z62_01295 [Candidatus Terrybacteria bacterium RIFCSPLOWO2_02_42_20]|uniref:Uncharacterized protein n=2 Tax=Candidatus Terryibacteriota TaxID=1817920 RepID=A0A1G2PSQ8_9BACT|nr:MAG: hypothetical protein A2W59_01525 [Candidatus Terrybacteria bacterium RIFCSPHIGHO2_02_41_19]OHA54454.1 MAG: hypothetical protein A2Z62_01295 [Candidatus Terrybacteria bacterium RIFCSPLOWO2_02_42_20]
MEMLLIVLWIAGSLFIGMGARTLLLGGNRNVSFCVFVGLFLVLASRGMETERAKGRPTSHENLIVGENYEVVAIYDGNGKYVVTKELTNEKKIRLVGPLNFGTTSVGVGDVYIKTAGSLEKFLRH